MLGRPGIRGALIGCYPNGTLEITDEDDAVWARLVEAGVPLNIHVSLSQHMPAAHRAALPGYGRFFDAPNRIVQMIFAGVFDRFPELDGRRRRGRLRLGPVLQGADRQQLPAPRRRSATSRSRRCRASTSSAHLHFTYLTDPFGIDNRHVDRRRAHPLVERLPAHLE